MMAVAMEMTRIKILNRAPRPPLGRGVQEVRQWGARSGLVRGRITIKRSNVAAAVT
jgi:hypothetical protein